MSSKYQLLQYQPMWKHFRTLEQVAPYTRSSICRVQQPLLLLFSRQSVERFLAQLYVRTTYATAQESRAVCLNRCRQEYQRTLPLTPDRNLNHRLMPSDQHRSSEGAHRNTFRAFLLRFNQRLDRMGRTQSRRVARRDMQCYLFYRRCIIPDYFLVE